ncbi:hypothetical protein F3Y22_tig00110831pilonHSYRG00699 [Hibiscus syriacus]|uniref:Integrase catalytic domain-containing protein n=1 Tax=Hibiscus syriacus TaxID=106335 RepID=A0A6A2ZN72_HIBSY|nr:hypothetical protein F3Y22_tig00110831pilonHSYRG00699 [Hibiscus syriacus]
MIDASSSSILARNVVTIVRFAVEIFDGTGHFDMWQSEVLDALFQQGLDIAIEGEKPDDVEEKEWKRINRMTCGTIRSCLSREQKYAFSKETSASTTMNDHITSFNQLVTDLMNMDVTFKDENLALILMGSLLDEFEYLETTLLHGKVDVSLSEVIDALYSYELRKKDKQENTSVEAEALVVRGRSKSQNKGRRGRSKSKSRLRKDEYSACSHHMTPNREWFFDFKELKGGIVYTSNNSPLDTLGIGSIRLRNHDGSIRTLTSVHYVPDLMRNLISVGTLESKGLEVRAKDGIMRIISGALVIMKGIRKRNNVYFFLGHVGEKSLKLLIDQGLLKGARACKLAFFEHCIKGKKTRVKFGTTIHDTKGILDYVHSDIWGPSKTISLGGTHYYVTFVDDFSWRVWVYTMKTKDEVLGFFLKWKKMMETQTGRKIKRLRTDNGGEYKNDPFLKVCEEEGIVRHFTVRGKEFWAEALVYAFHLVNRLPSTAIGGKTPLEKWFGEPATDYDYLHVFGSTAYYHVKESKLDLRAKKAIFMGITFGDFRKIGADKWTPKQVKFEGNIIVPASKETDVDSPMVEEESDEEEVQTQEPPQQHESIALRKGKRIIRQPARYADMVSFASPIIIDDVPATFNEAVQMAGCVGVVPFKSWTDSRLDECRKIREIIREGKPGYLHDLQASLQPSSIALHHSHQPVVYHDKLIINGLNSCFCKLCALLNTYEPKLFKKKNRMYMMEEKRGLIGRKTSRSKDNVGESSIGISKSKTARTKMESTELLKYSPMGLTY